MFDERLSSWMRVIQNSAKKSLFFLSFSDMRTWGLQRSLTHANLFRGQGENHWCNTSSLFSQQQDEGLFEKN